MPRVTVLTLGSEISSCDSPLSPLSNPASLINIGFSKEDLCQISHSDLIIDKFSKANLYDVPQVTVSTFGSEKYIQETTVRPLSVPSYEILIRSPERKL